MSQRKILLICACGSSTSILMQSMRENLAEDENWEIVALSVSEGKKVFGKYDTLLLAPQIKYQTNMIKDLCKDFPDMEIYNIDAKDFGRCNGPAVLNMIRKNA